MKYPVGGDVVKMGIILFIALFVFFLIFAFLGALVYGATGLTVYSWGGMVGTIEVMISLTLTAWITVLCLDQKTLK